VAAGIKGAAATGKKGVAPSGKRPARNDVALIVSDRPASAAAVFTTNKVKAAPVRLAMKKIRSGQARAIVVNSGNANACTGARGMEDARVTADFAAGALGINAGEVLVASTGVIGEPLPMDRLVRGVLDAALVLDGSVEDVARAIMTTDTVPKVSARTLIIGGKRVTLTGIAKGSGMIAPNMATMLCFLVTDAAVEPKALDTMLRRAVGRSFNRITVDGDRSTNDTAMILANGAAGNRAINLRSADLPKLQDAMNRVTWELSRMIAADGEGASRLVEVYVKNARTESDAEKAAMAIANSMLVKTAVYGRDANWGRILAAAGYSAAVVREEKASIFINRVKVASAGMSTGRDKAAAREMDSGDIVITLDLGLGSGEARVMTCDLTEKYIVINAQYRT